MKRTPAQQALYRWPASRWVQVRRQGRPARQVWDERWSQVAIPGALQARHAGALASLLADPAINLEMVAASYEELNALPVLSLVVLGQNPQASFWMAAADEHFYKLGESVLHRQVALAILNIFEQPAPGSALAGEPLEERVARLMRVMKSWTWASQQHRELALRRLPMRDKLFVSEAILQDLGKSLGRGVNWLHTMEDALSMPRSPTILSFMEDT